MMENFQQKAIGNKIMGNQKGFPFFIKAGRLFLKVSFNIHL